VIYLSKEPLEVAVMMKLSTMRRVVDTLDQNWASPIAENILKNWKHDPNSAIYFRASANFVFRFTRDGKNHFLRFNSLAERKREEIEGEIELLEFLNQQGSNIVKPVLSLNNRFIEEYATGEDTYLAVVFEALEGKRYEIEELKNEQFFLWGKALGKLHHQLDKAPDSIKRKRKNWKTHLSFIREQVNPANTSACRELERLEKWAEENHAPEGLIHFDFELDNVHWHDKALNILDFDDSAVYWYGADIAFALRDLFGEGIDNEHTSLTGDGIDMENPSFRRFMEGYSSQFRIDPNLYRDLPVFIRFHNLFFYARLSRSIDIVIDEDTPDWLSGLYHKLSSINGRLQKSFDRII